MTYTPRPDATSEERLAMVELVACDIHNRLFGNGQPGEIERNRADAEKKIDALRREVDRLHKKVYRASAASSAAMGVAGAAIGAIAKGYFTR